ncbi:MAG: DUF2007 domain-containing protein [Actinomycetota bacterium]
MPSKKPPRRPRWGAGLFDPLGSSLPDGWVDVARAPDGPSAGLLESLLREAGIPVMLWKPAVFPYLGSGIGGVRTVLVPEGRREEACELLADRWDTVGGEEGDGGTDGD